MNQRPVRLRELAATFARVGFFGFGGGMGMLALLRSAVLEKRRWLSDEEFATSVAIAQMIPGPFIPNCVEYIGYRLRGLKGMTVSALAFLLPSVLAILVLSIIYFRFGTVPRVQAVFEGIEPVVVGILLAATWQMALPNCRNWRAMLIALIACLALLFLVDVLMIIAICGILGVILFREKRSKPDSTAAGCYLLFSPWYAPATIALQTGPALIGRALELFGIFLKIGAIVWGGGYAALPFIKAEVVDARSWLTAREFVDGVALGQITPGPVAITATFVGYRVLGLTGAFLATLGMFLPSFLMLLGVIRVYDRIRENHVVKAFLRGILPAVVGLLLATAVLIAKDSGTNLPRALLSTASLILIVVAQVNPVWLIAGGALAGLAFSRIL